jgi:predicted enzyme related to lactoylglutathione lyase
MAFFDCDGISLYLGVPETEEYRSRGMIYFSVPDVDEAYAALSQRGVSFLDAPHVVHRAETWELRMAFFTDPDGNNLALMAEVPIPQTVG